MAMPNVQIGIQTQVTSLRRISNALPSKKARTLNGDVTNGRHGKKYRRLSNGTKNPTPSPASVNASRNPCEAHATKNNANNAAPEREKRGVSRCSSAGRSIATQSANVTE